MRMSPFKKQEPSMSMDELQKMSAAQDAASKAQADKLPQIEKPGFDYEMDQDMSYPGGERGRDYDEEGTKDGMSRKAKAGYVKHKTLTVKGKPLEYNPKFDPKKLITDQSEARDKASMKKDKDKKLKKTKDQLGVSRNESPLNATRAERRMSKTKDKAAEAKEKASENKSAESNQRNRAKAKRLDKRAERQEDRAERKQKRKSKKAKLSKANRGVAVTSVGSVKSSGIKKDVKSSDSDIQDSTRAKVKKSLA